jgi:hypothetical protein
MFEKHPHIQQRPKGEIISCLFTDAEVPRSYNDEKSSILQTLEKACYT